LAANHHQPGFVPEELSVTSEAPATQWMRLQLS
jgi:hypothetical protein